MYFTNIDEYSSSDFFLPIPYGPTELFYDLSPTTAFQSPLL